MFPFLIGKVLTQNGLEIGDKSSKFPFLIGKVLTSGVQAGEIIEDFRVSIPYR